MGVFNCIGIFMLLESIKVKHLVVDKGPKASALPLPWILLSWFLLCSVADHFNLFLLPCVTFIPALVIWETDTVIFGRSGPDLFFYRFWVGFRSPF